MARGTDSKASSSRGRGKFKVSRGGGRHFSRDIAVVDQEMENLGLGGSDDDEDDSSEESSDDEGGGAGGRSAEPEMSRAERKAMKKAQAGKKSTQQQGSAAKALPPQSEEEESGEESEEVDKMLQSGPLARTGPTRKERAWFARFSADHREAAEKKAAAERYQKLHAAGKFQPTCFAQKDMARLAEIRRKREAEAAARKAREEEASREAEEKRQARLNGKR
ncbi:hypothetical protein QFC19_002865 [Naganishia cerealis]|uniref:Uncharacterized protein n=1 Tax=Naganishia cerealis TaxID=610337 RepID=A0ACC2W8S3_9TREE|nr:hypothetical protein QFC19_002865 [Naganishia cerealis]